MTSKLTREQLHERARENVKALKMASRQHAFESAREEILADLRLAELALAAMDSEPVEESVTCWSCRNEVEISAIGDRDGYCPICDAPIDLDEEPYTSPQPAPDREQVRREHAEWSQATFGNVGPVGPLKHLSKEALEAAAEPGDLSEWADMQFLMWDAQRRAGITDEQITQAMFEKLAVNKRRSWPETKDGEPRLHIKAQPAPEKYNIGDATMRHIFTPTGMTSVSDMQAVFDRVEAVLVGMEQPAPVVPDGWVMVPKEPTSEMQSAGASAIRIETTAVNKLWTGNAVYWAMLAAAPQEVK